MDDEGTGDIIKNYGHITGAFTGVLLGGLSDGGDLLNYGSIRGGSFGVQELSNNTGGTIVNYGNISSAQTGVEVWTNTDLTTSIVNKASRVISGHTHAIFVNTQGGISLTNYGTINGNIDCNSDSGDAIHNHGKIHGIVELYNRSDFFDGRGGTSGAIFCAGNDHVIAGNGNLSIHAGAGESTLTGGSGHDSFFFDVALDPFAQPTIITNFVHGTDKIVLSEAIFGGLGPHGKLGAAHFHVGDPVNSVAQIDYNPSSGELDYRAHGNAGPAIDFATLINVPSVTASDFHLIA